MKSDYIMTKQQADEKIKCLEEVFDVVRLLDADTLQVVDGNSHENYCECYKFGIEIQGVKIVFPVKQLNLRLRKQSLNILSHRFIRSLQSM